MSLKFHNKTKYIDYRFSKAPQIKAGYGSFVNILTEVLSVGFNFNTPIIIEKLEEGKIKIDFAVSPQFPRNSIIKITGTGDSRLDKDHRIMETSGNYIEIYIESFGAPLILPAELAGVSVCIAPLGYEKVYSNVDKTTVCFKNGSKNYPGVLKVIDELPPNGYSTGWGYFARVVVGEELDLEGEFINNIKTPYSPDFPNAEKTGNGVQGVSGIHGYAKWKYRATDDPYGRDCYGSLYSLERPWYIVGDDKTFYLIINPGPDTSLFGFGNIETTGGGAIALQAVDDFVVTSANPDRHLIYGKRRNFWGNLNNTYIGSFLLHSIYGVVKHNTFRYYSGGYYFGENEKHTPWKSNEINFHNDNSGRSMISDLLISDQDGYFRGCHRGIKIMYGFNDIPSGSIPGTNDMCIRVTDPLRNGGSMPIMFSQEDWSDVDSK